MFLAWQHCIAGHSVCDRIFCSKKRNVGILYRVSIISIFNVDLFDELKHVDSIQLEYIVQAN